MLKIRIISLMLVLLMLTASFYSCGSNPSPSDVIGGGTVTPPASASYDFAGLKDFHLNTAAASADFLAGVTVSDNGKTEIPTVDSSEVVFGTPGEYSVKYTYKEVTKTQKVFIYGTPQINSAADVTLSYSEAFSGLESGISASDTFGGDLDVFIYNDGGLYSIDGSLNYGTFLVNYNAVDLAGNIVSASRNVTISQDTSEEPLFISSPSSYDVVDEKLDFAVNFKGGIFVGISFDGKLVPYGSRTVSSGALSIDGGFIASGIGLGQKTVRLISNLGYKEISINITDDAVPQIRAEGNNYIYPLGKAVLLPDAVRLNSRQAFSIKKGLYNSGGQSVSVTNGEFTASSAGDYEYRITAVKPDSREYLTTVTVKVVTAAEYDKIIDLAISGQFTSRFLIDGGNDASFSLTWKNAELSGRTGYLAMHTGTRGSWYNRFELMNVNGIGHLTSVTNLSSYTKITAKIYLTAATDLFMWLNASDVRLSTGGIKLYDNSAEVTYANIGSNLNKWLDIEIPISTYVASASNKRMAFGAGQLNTGAAVSTDIYLADMRFA